VHLTKVCFGFTKQVLAHIKFVHKGIKKNPAPKQDAGHFYIYYLKTLFTLS